MSRFGFTIEDDEQIGLDGAYRNLLFKVHNNEVEGTVVGVASGNGNWAFGGTQFANGYRVSVNGKMACEEVMVDLKADWPDYVFKDDYKLKTLNEVEKHIHDKGHLPGVPSAEEVADKGLMLGDMNKVMMEKIEELTLYILEQQKQLDAQNQLIREQEKRLIQLENK